MPDPVQTVKAHFDALEARYCALLEEIASGQGERRRRRQRQTVEAISMPPDVTSTQIGRAMVLAL